MSPEHMGKAEDLRPASDLYSFGVILYELATGELPFGAASPMDTMLMHRDPNRRPKPPSQVNLAVPPELEQLILRLMAKDPADRFTAVALAATARNLLGTWAGAY